jgi:hypothetical protein
VTKAEKTKELIIAKAAPLFNKKGYAGTSMSDIMNAWRKAGCMAILKARMKLPPWLLSIRTTS